MHVFFHAVSLWWMGVAGYAQFTDAPAADFWGPLLMSAVFLGIARAEERP